MTSPPRHLYVHVPFCARRCSYCDFAIAVRARVPVAEYVRALRGELALRYGSGQQPTLDTLYFGGGTPSRLGGEGVAQAIDAVRDFATLAPGVELTIEVNPEDVRDDALEAWTRAGVNRLSIGGQSFSEEALGWMHRGHGGAGIAHAVERARAHGIENVSLDLIFALPDRVQRSWEDDIDRALALEPSHLSLYGLTFEPATPLARWRDRGEADEASEERYGDEFLRAHERLTLAGLVHYEVSNFALPGRESRHNSSYWCGAAYGGVGPSAHAFDGERRSWNVPHYAEWVQRLEQRRDPRAGDELLTDENRLAEEVYLGLRTRRGLVLRDGESARAASWVAAGWAELENAPDGRRLLLTAEGWLRLDAIAADLTLLRSR